MRVNLSNEQKEELNHLIRCTGYDMLLINTTNRKHYDYIIIIYDSLTNNTLALYVTEWRLLNFLDGIGKTLHIDYEQMGFAGVNYEGFCLTRPRA